MLGTVLLIAASVMWGVSNVLLKRSISAGMSPESANAVQTSFSALFMLAIWISMVSFGGLDIPHISLWPMIYLVTGTLVGLALGTTIYLHGLKLVDASLASPLSQTSPFFVMLMAAAFLGEDITFMLVSGALLIFAGVLFLGKKEGRRESSRKGIILVSIAPVFWAMTIVMYRVALKDIDIYTANAIRMPLLGAFMCLYVRWKGIACFPDRKAVYDAAGAGVFNYVLGGTAFLFGLTMVGASRASALSSATPFFTMLFAALFLGERVKRDYVFGAALVVLGLVLLAFS